MINLTLLNRNKENFHYKNKTKKCLKLKKIIELNKLRFNRNKNKKLNRKLMI